MTPEAHGNLEFAALTDIGRVRRQNEDAVAISAGCGFALLADGMGGHLAGEVASGMAATIIKQALEDKLLRHAGGARAEVRQHLQHWVREAIALANERILQAAQNQPGCRGMGTTLMLALHFDNTLCVAHIGDSRLYRLRGAALQLLTRDHSLLQEQIAAGLITPEQAAHSRDRNLITRALGVAALVEAELHDHDFQPGDIALLCSDGLTDMVPEPQIAGLLDAHRSNLPHACAQLIACANERGGQDNVSVVLLKARDNERRFGTR
ncbi:Stp1/IreP family PP2C-type Ser/Thr phosphatase [Herminiimonas sp. CN]|uniref:Stp1/IreP family PP2C-type Ser/Thr phosphatase n=1 Tax=Herminiimonas sp. CN TaxID=1349818 RepID=UPI00047443F0|nr:Stp1/IreP family PP2C-type Ser/Thr phosphatase [Herminiimonas sp. CN]